MIRASSSTTKISSFVLTVIFITLALSLMALIVAVALSAYSGGQENLATLQTILLLVGFVGVTFSMYVLFQTRKRILGLRIEVPQVTTIIECKKCGFKSVREFQRGDYIFKEVEPCQKCNEKMLITAIYKEIKEKEKGAFPF